MLNVLLLDLMHELGCQVPDCDHRHGFVEPLYFDPKCHGRSGLKLAFDPPGVLRLQCAECSDQILEIAVTE